MSRFVYGHDEKLASWAAGMIPEVGPGGFGPCRAIGIADDDERILYGVIVYHSYDAHNGLCCFGLASLNPRWVTKENVRRLLAYPFRQLGVRKLVAVIAYDNERSIRFARGMAFKKDATLRHHFGDGRHAEVWSMMRNEFEAKWGTPASFSRYRRLKAQRDIPVEKEMA